VKVTEARPLKKCKLFLRFDDGASGVVDLGEIAGRGVFEWPGELDLCADALYLKLTGKQPEDIFPALRQRATHA